MNYPSLDLAFHDLLTLRFNGTFPMIPAESTSFVHDGVTMTEYENEPFIVGDFNHNEVEFMHLSHEKWYSARAYPFQERLFGYAAVSRPGRVFILGGCCYDDWSLVSMFQDHEWSKIGHLKQGRMNFLAIKYQTHVLLVGGMTRGSKT